MRLMSIAVSLLATLPLLGGCTGEDRSDQVAPVTEAVDALPGVTASETHWPKSLKMNESYSLTVSPDRGGSGQQLCAALPVFRRALDESGFPAAIADVNLTDGTSWHLSVPGDADEGLDADALCDAAIRLRRLPADTRVDLFTTPPTITVRINHGAVAKVRHRAVSLLGDHAGDFDLSVS